MQELGPICAVTTTVPDLAPIEAAYTQYLGYRVLSRGTVAEKDACGWGAPDVAECRLLALLPEHGEATCLRFIEDPRAGSVPAFVSHGWNATEITVRDTDALAQRLAESPFRIIGPPKNLTGFEWIRAMQVLGPAGECLYLTDVGGDASLAAPSALVGQVFITVVAGADMAALQAFYRDRFSNPVSDPVSIPIGVITEANHLPQDTLHPLALVTLPAGTRIELDEYPPCTSPRPVVPGHLPPGMSMVSFAVDRLPDTPFLAGDWISAMPDTLGRTAGCLRGAAGELLELVAAQPRA